MEAVCKNFFYTVLFLLLLLGCGEKAGPEINFQLTYSTDNPFNDPEVSWLRFVALPLDGDGNVLDLNEDGSPDAFAYPESCIVNKAWKAGCGFSLTEASFKLSNLPLNNIIEIQAQFWNAATDNMLYSGSTQFVNQASTQTYLIVVSKNSSL